MKLFRALIIALAVTLSGVNCLNAADEPGLRIPLWENGPPGFENRKDEPELAKDYWVRNIHQPSVTAYLPTKEKATGAAVIICPGGGHRELVFNGEGRDAGQFLSEMGVAAFALKYRLAREEGSPYSLDIHPRQDGQRAMRLVRSRAAEWGLDPGRIGILGFSAGGEVASLVTYAPGDGKADAEDPIDRVSSRPDFQMLVYPGPLGIPETIPETAPPAFLVVANDDGAARSLLDVLTRYRNAGLPVEAHFFNRGGHAFNMGGRSQLKSIRGWPHRMADWMSDNFILDTTGREEWLKQQTAQRERAKQRQERQRERTQATTLAATTAAIPAGRQPKPQVRYELTANSKKQEGVPEGRLEGPFLFHSKVIENTVRKFWISVPAQYDGKQPACVLVFQDGARATNPGGVLRVPQVLDNLIAKHAIPVTNGIYITPGHRGQEFPDSIGTGNPDNRDREYDVMDDAYARMIVDEILPKVGEKYSLTNDPAGRAIGGSSSGGICAFTVAWHKPDQFRNVISLIGSFTDIHGGHVYPQLIRDNPVKPIRIFLQDGKNDNRNPINPNMDWYQQNQAMIAAFTSQKYDMAYVFGEGGHSDDHGGAILPEMLQWIWHDYPGVKSSSAEELVEIAKRCASTTVDPFPGFDSVSMIDPIGQWKWENNFNRTRRTEVLTIEGDRSRIHGRLESTEIVDGQPVTSVTTIDKAEIVGNKLSFDVMRERNNRKFEQTFQGIVSDKAVVGWSISEFNGTQQDRPWRAERIAVAAAAVSPIGDFETASDVGPVRKPGSTVYDPIAKTYELTGAGTNMWADKDECHIVWKKLAGDFVLDANVKMLGEGVDPHRKLGLIVRKSLDTNSAYADVAVHGDGLTSLQFRRTDGAKTEQVQSTIKGPERIRLSRTGSKYVMSVAKAGEEFTAADGVELDLGNDVSVGLFICSHNPDVVEKGIFTNVQITPVPVEKPGK